MGVQKFVFYAKALFFSPGYSDIPLTNAGVQSKHGVLLSKIESKGEHSLAKRFS